MRRSIAAAALIAAFLPAAGVLQAAAPAQPAARAAPRATARGGQAWIAESDALTKRLLDVQFEHSPESGSRQGLARYDTRISDPTLADELAERKQLEAVLAGIEREAPHV